VRRRPNRGLEPNLFGGFKMLAIGKNNSILMWNSELLKVRFAGDFIVLKITSGKFAAVISEISNLPLNDNIYLSTPSTVS